MSNEPPLEIIPSKRYLLSWYVPIYEKWMTCETDSASTVMTYAEFVVKQQGREFRVKDVQERKVYHAKTGTELACLLNLFSIALSDRCGKSSEE